MTKDEYRATISRLGLSQVGAARALGINPRTSRRYASGEQPVPRIVQNLLRVLEINQLAVQNRTAPASEPHYPG